MLISFFQFYKSGRMTKKQPRRKEHINRGRNGRERWGLGVWKVWPFIGQPSATQHAALEVPLCLTCEVPHNTLDLRSQKLQSTMGQAALHSLKITSIFRFPLTKAFGLREISELDPVSQSPPKTQSQCLPLSWKQASLHSISRKAPCGVCGTQKWPGSVYTASGSSETRGGWQYFFPKNIT